jgi:hypothetical protein
VSPRLIRRVAAVAVLSVLVAGVGYIALRDRSWESKAQLAVTPTTADPNTAANLLGNLQESGTIGTRVEQISSKDTLDAAGRPPIQVTVRAVPDTRVIDVTATGQELAVQGGLTRLLEAAQAGDAKLDDPWKLTTIASPSAPALAGPGNALVAGATILLALLAGLATLVGLRRLEPEIVLPTTEKPAGPEGLHAVQRRQGERVAERR